MGVTVQQGYTVAAAGGLSAATQAEQEAGASTAVATTPGRQQYHPSAAKCWAFVTYSGSTPTLAASYNITSITDTGVGDLTITIATDFSSASWSSSVSLGGSSVGTQISTSAPAAIQYGAVAAGSIKIGVHEGATGTTGDPVDPTSISFQGYGDQ